MRGFVSVLAVGLWVAPARAAAPDPYPAASQTLVLRVGHTLDYHPPGIVVQLICDHVGRLIAVTATGPVLHIRGLAPGITACSIQGLRDRHDAPDGGHSGALDYRILVEIRVLSNAPAHGHRPIPRSAP